MVLPLNTRSTTLLKNSPYELTELGFSAIHLKDWTSLSTAISWMITYVKYIYIYILYNVNSWLKLWIWSFHNNFKFKPKDPTKNCYKMPPLPSSFQNCFVTDNMQVHCTSLFQTCQCLFTYYKLITTLQCYLLQFIDIFQLS